MCSGCNTLSGKVLAPRSLKASLNRLFSPLFKASLIAIGVSADGAELVDAMLTLVLVAEMRLMTTMQRSGG